MSSSRDMSIRELQGIDRIHLCGARSQWDTEAARERGACPRARQWRGAPRPWRGGGVAPAPTWGEYPTSVNITVCPWESTKFFSTRISVSWRIKPSIIAATSENEKLRSWE